MRPAEEVRTQMVILRGERVLLRPARPEDAGRKKLAWPRRCESRESGTVRTGPRSVAWGLKTIVGRLLKLSAIARASYERRNSYEGVKAALSKRTRRGRKGRRSGGNDPRPGNFCGRLLDALRGPKMSAHGATGRFVLVVMAALFGTAGGSALSSALQL